MRSLRRFLIAATVSSAIALSAVPASAHVTVNPREAEKGGFAKLAFRTPNERDDSGTVKVEVTFPEEHPLFSVSVKPIAGWRATVERGTLREPVEVFGEPRTDPVTKITWEGSTIEPGQFQEFEISAGPLPDDADQLVFKALQTYASGEVVRWIEEPEEGQEEPEHPAPILTLVEAASGGGDEPASSEDDAESAAGDEADDDDDDETDPLLYAALGIAIVALLVSLVAASRKR